MQIDITPTSHESGRDLIEAMIEISKLNYDIDISVDIEIIFYMIDDKIYLSGTEIDKDEAIKLADKYYYDMINRD